MHTNIHRLKKYEIPHYHLIYRRDFLLLASLDLVDVLPTVYPLPFASARTSTCTPWSSLLLPLLPVLAESTSWLSPLPLRFVTAGSE